MRFHGLMLIRDEDDIVLRCLEHLLTWIDAVYILDLGSKDSTWQIVNEAAAKDRRIVPWKSEPYRYGENLRAYAFDTFRSRFEEGDWVLRLDADEFYQMTPPDFVSQRLRPHESCVNLAWYFFRLTSPEVEDYETGKVAIAEDRLRPIEDRRRFYKIPDYAEPRMFRYRASMKWPGSRSLPFNAGYMAKERIPIRHYPHRDPEQMRKRYRLRAAMMELNADAGPHWRLKEWQKDVLQMDGSGSREQTGISEGLSAAEGHTAGKLHYWQPGMALPPIDNDIKHHSPSLRRAAQRVSYPHIVRWMDVFREPWVPVEPQTLPAEIQSRL